MKHLTTPLSPETARSLVVGDEVMLSGTVYAARDQAHSRLCALVEKGEKIPFDLEGTIIYFVGPTPAPPGKVVGSAGPTTSGRMDAFSPILLRAGLTAMIGKGNRSAEVIEAMKANGSVYFAATGGVGALIAQCIKSTTCAGYEDLGMEAIYRMEVEDFPMIVAIDSKGENLYIKGPEKYRKSLTDALNPEAKESPYHGEGVS
jgi:fumarate hydratase subunit beta